MTFDIAILCGGMAKRLNELTKKTPKSLIEINGKPFIYYQIRLLESKGFKKIVLCVGHLGNQIEEYVKSINTNAKILFSYDGEELVGTGGAINKALPSYENKTIEYTR